MSVHFDRALLLYQRDQHAAAEQELREALTEEPSNPMAHALLGLSLSGLERFDEAQRETESAVHLGPDFPFAHYALASVLQDRGKGKEAEASVREAIRLDAEEPDFRALLASILMGRRDWTRALSAAEEGLRIESDHVACNNLRAMALVNLGRRDEAGATIDAALMRDPEDAGTHANQGWTLLHQGKPEKALEHFKEALRLDPTLDWARQGIVEALKARNPVYGIMLKYFLWMGRLSRRAQWGVTIGGYLGYQVLRALLRIKPEWEIGLWACIITYLVFVFMTWIASPLFNLLLRLNRFGRLALDGEQVTAANWLGAALATALLALTCWAVTRHWIFLGTSAGAAFLAIPVAGTFSCQPGWPRRVMATYTILLLLLGAGFLAFQSDPRLVGSGVWQLLFWTFVIGAALSTWVANLLAMARPTR